MAKLEPAPEVTFSPLNTELQDFWNMDNDPLPKQLLMVLGMVYWSSVRIDQVQCMMNTASELVKIVSAIASPVPVTVQVEGPCLPQYCVRTLTQSQVFWMHHGIYVQCGFIDPASITGPVPQERVLYAMNFLDNMIDRSESAQAKRISPLRFPGYPVVVDLEHYYRSTIGDLFHQRTGIWSHQLVDYRNEVLVKARSWLRGEDPDTEYRVFKHTGKEYFLWAPSYRTVVKSDLDKYDTLKERTNGAD